MSRTIKKKEKSPSQRLKSVYFKLWEQDSEGVVDFEDYYEDKMEKLIAHFKTKIL